MIKLILAITFSFIYQTPPEREINFGVFHKDHEIGHVKVTKEEKNGVSFYKVRSEVTYDTWFYDYHRISNINARFANQKLLYCESKVIEGGELEKHRETKNITSDKYKCSGNDGDSFHIDKDIPLISSLLYFNEPPDNASKVYSETLQKLLVLRVLDNNIYEIDFPGNELNRYFYSNGKLLKVVVKRRWFTIEFRRKS